MSEEPMTKERIAEIEAVFMRDIPEFAHDVRDAARDLLAEVERQSELREDAEEKLKIAINALRNISMLSVSDESCCRWAHGQAMIALTRLKVEETK